MKALDGISHEGSHSGLNRAAGGKAVDWRKSMSDNAAIALIVYTGLNIFLTVEAIRETGMRSLAMVCLILLVAAIIPACRMFEKRWREASEEEAHDRALSGAYRRDQLALWLLALGLPFGLTALFSSLA